MLKLLKRGSSLVLHIYLLHLLSRNDAAISVKLFIMQDLPTYHPCPYCNSLQKAIKNHNYCSNSGDDIQTVKSNAFYLSSNQINSGKHLSRLSIRSVLNGYQYYKTGKEDRMVKKDNYLIINEGQTWFSEIEAENPVEAIVLAFHPEVVKKVIYSLTHSSNILLDNPTHSKELNFNLSENTYLSDDKIKQLFLQIKAIIKSENNNDLLFEEVEYNMLELIFQKHQELLETSSLIPAKNKAVQKELMMRLGLAKDYIISNLDKKLSITTISMVAALSPYHFLRLFKALYKTTPHQFLTKERMKLAYYLLLNSSKTVQEITSEVGFESHSSFGRAFKNNYGMSPFMLRESQMSSLINVLA